MSRQRTIEEATAFLYSVNFTPKQREEIDLIQHRLNDNEYEAAMYIVWLQNAPESC